MDARNVIAFQPVRSSPVQQGTNRAKRWNQTRNFHGNRYTRRLLEECVFHSDTLLQAARKFPGREPAFFAELTRYFEEERAA